ncbi:N-acetyltransferase [Tumidithrix elongata RA019]|uniref:N-acetyltransferase n=1 Tax=Tumidithrix elongata BACA0141 TaxID=2716417 RepID=A0AAW9Q7L1_9CYAN|nr:N-acetyltransferase [Tumidithrix elongata RA019]
MRNLLFRDLTYSDRDTLWQMLMYAAHEQTLEAVKSQALLVRYVENWGRAGDLGMVAVEPHSDRALGAAWLRLWTPSERGFGFVRDTTPELAMAVAPEYRGKGIGTQLLDLVLETAKIRYSEVSLSVRAENPVLGLYDRVGFTKVAGSEVRNRVGGISLTMVKKL